MRRQDACHAGRWSSARPRSGSARPLIAALINAAAVSPAAAQDEVTLSFDAGATGGGGGKPNAAAIAYCYIVNGGSQYELNRMVDARLITLNADIQDYVWRPGRVVGDRGHDGDVHAAARTRSGTTARPVTAKDIIFTLNVHHRPGRHLALGRRASRTSSGTPRRRPPNRRRRSPD